jgi:hypothetical protein
LESLYHPVEHVRLEQALKNTITYPYQT